MKVDLMEVLKSDKFISNKGGTFLPIGMDSQNKAIYADLAATGGILIGGKSGSGKSTFLHSMIASLISKSSPEDLRFILVDPKKLELSIYGNMESFENYLITPVITDNKKVLGALKWAWGEVCRRFSDETIYSYSNRKKRPDIYFIIDEFSIPMTDYGRDLGAIIPRLGTVGPFVGVYTILATSSPDPKRVYSSEIVDSFKTKIAFQTANPKDSKIILGKRGAELLTDVGQMLFKSGKQARKLQGFYIDTRDNAETSGIIKELTAKYEHIEKERELNKDDRDYLYGDARELVITAQKASASFLQRRLKIGYARAAMLLDILEDNGVVGSSNGAEPREVLMTSLSEVDKENPPRYVDFSANYDKDDSDELYDEAKMIVIKAGSASASVIQRRLDVGYARAARLLDLLEEAGVIGPGEGAKPRTVYIRPDGTVDQEADKV